MANNRTTTSANAVLLLMVEGLFPTPQQIQGFGPDDMISTDQIENIENSMGADGRMSAGWTPAMVPMTITLQADSLSADFFERWIEAQVSLKQPYIANGTLVYPSVGKKYDLRRGVLKGAMKLPSAGRVLRARPYRIDWESVTPSSTGTSVSGVALAGALGL